MKPHFFCDICNTQVDAQQPSCPTCGASFLGVRCPACQHNGEVSDFLNGCPACGYNIQNQPIKTSTPKNSSKKTKQPRSTWQVSTSDLTSLTIALIIVMLVFIIIYFFRN